MTLVRGAGIVLVAAARRRDARTSGPKTRGRGVRRLTLHGVKHVDERDLRRHLVTEETAHVVMAPKQLVVRSPFALRLDTATVESYYRTRGFFDAARHRHRRDAGRSRALGQRRDLRRRRRGRPRSRRSTSRGSTSSATTPKKIFRNLDLRRGQIFDYGRYEAEKGEMRQRLRTLGYAWVQIDGDVVVDRDRHVADVTLQDRSRAARD